MTDDDRAPNVVAIDEHSGLDDPRLADYRQLADPASGARHADGGWLICEGLVALGKLAASDHVIRSVLCEPKHRDRVVEQLGDREVTVFVAAPDVLRGVVGFRFHRGVVASADRLSLPSVAALVTTVAAAPTGRLLVAEGLNDPENLGLIARTARAFGVDGVVIDPRCIDPYYRRTIRVSMGEILRLPTARSVDWPSDLDVIHAAGFETWAMTPQGDVDLAACAPPSHLAIVVGAEGPGLDRATIERATRRVRIPIDPAVDSINVGHASAIALSATTR